MCGATWERPDGVNLAANNMPVTQVSYYDACMYCEWKGGRLETIEEWTSNVNWQGDKPNDLDTGIGKLLPADQADSRLGNVWEWVLEGAVVGGSYLCSAKTCAGTSQDEYVHYPGLDAGASHIGFRCKLLN